MKVIILITYLKVDSVSYIFMLNVNMLRLREEPNPNPLFPN